MKTKDNRIPPGGFTLLELIMVLAIISMMVAVTLPFCKRSSDALKINQDSRDIAQSIRYAIDLSEKRNRAVEFVFNQKRNSYSLQIEDDQNRFYPVDDFTGTERYIHDNVSLFDIEGFEQTGQEYSIIFDPQKQWPCGRIRLFSNDLIVTVEIKSRHVDIKEESI